ncbi:MAG: hypothetical protein AB1Z98_29835 [Nannocystaceae bacterium]
MPKHSLAAVMGLALVVGCGSDDSPPGAATTGTTTTATTAQLDTAQLDTSAGPEDQSDSTGTPALPCNGHPQLCERPFDQVVFAGTHNSHSALDDGFPMVNANQEHGIGQQLDDGIRVLLIDVYPDEAEPGTVLMCHGPCSLASTPHLQGLATIVQFLRDHPRELITIIYEDHVAVSELVEDFVQTEADALTFTRVPGEPWPTLGAMIEADTRLVITAETAGPPPAWLHHVWDEAWDTPYGPMQAEDLSCALNRGSPDNDLYLVNHWVNDAFGLPSAEAAAVVNEADVLQTRAQACWRQWDHPPNFLVVDFYEQGDLLAVVDALNGV